MIQKVQCGQASFDGHIYLKSVSFGKPQVDRAKMTINGFKVATLGEARGHGVILDDVTLSQLVTLGNAAGKLKCRFTHPLSTDGLGSFVGFASNFRREGDSVLADLEVSPVAAKSPRGDLADYVLSLAEAAPESFGASPQVKLAKEKVKGQNLPSLRVLIFRAVDLVDDPATNDGLFEAGKCDMSDSVTPGGNPADEVAKLKEELRAEFKAVAAGEVASLKAQFEKEKADAVSLASKEATEKALADESQRQADILSLCTKAKRPELAEGYLKEKLSTSQVQEKLFAALCEANKPVGDDTGKPGENAEDAKYLSEYKASEQAYLKAGMSKDDYIAQRRIDDGLTVLTAKVA